MHHFFSSRLKMYVINEYLPKWQFTERIFNKMREKTFPFIISFRSTKSVRNVDKKTQMKTPALKVRQFLN